MGIALSAGLFLYYIFYALPGEGPLPAEIRVEQGESLATVARKLRRSKDRLERLSVFALGALERR